MQIRKYKLQVNQIALTDNVHHAVIINTPIPRLNVLVQRHRQKSSILLKRRSDGSPLNSRRSLENRIAWTD